MNDLDPEIRIHNDTVPRLMGRTITQERIGHYSGVIDHLVGSAARKFYELHHKYPSQDAIKAYEHELIQMLYFRQDVNQALQIKLIDGILST